MLSLVDLSFRGHSMSRLPLGTKLENKVAFLCSRLLSLQKLSSAPLPGRGCMLPWISDANGKNGFALVGSRDGSFFSSTIEHSRWMKIACHGLWNALNEFREPNYHNLVRLWQSWLNFQLNVFQSYFPCTPITEFIKLLADPSQNVSIGFIDPTVSTAVIKQTKTGTENSLPYIDVRMYVFAKPDSLTNYALTRTTTSVVLRWILI